MEAVQDISLIKRFKFLRSYGLEVYECDAGNAAILSTPQNILCEIYVLVMTCIFTYMFGCSVIGQIHINLDLGKTALTELLIFTEQNCAFLRTGKALISMDKSEQMQTPYVIRSRSLIIQALWFLIAYVMLHILWSASRGTGAERLAVDSMTVKPVATLINLLTPSVNAAAAGTRIMADGGGINISNGCEGTEALFLLMAAIISCPFPWRVKMIGLLSGMLLIYSLNQIRILVLFYAYRSDQELFDQLHHNIAPLALIAAGALFFFLWTAGHASRNDHVAAGA